MVPQQKRLTFEPGEEASLISLTAATAVVDETLRRAKRAGTMAYPANGSVHGYQKVSAGWKCMWTHGLSQCTLLLLPRGQRIRSIELLAIAWAEEQSQQRGLSLRYACTNPAGVDRDNMLVRLLPIGIGSSQFSAQNTTPDVAYYAWIHRGAVRRGGLGADARGFWVDRFSFFAFFNRVTTWRWVDRNGQRSATPTGIVTNIEVRMFAQNLSNASSVPVQLHLGSQQPWEKNWQPFRQSSFRHQARVYLSYRTQPAHIVLSCDLETGNCTTAYTVESPQAWALLGDRTVETGGFARLSTPAILVHGVNVAVGHYRVHFGVYIHFFFSFEPNPPFAILRTSKPFRILRNKHNSSERWTWRPHPIQYVGGLYLHEGRVVLTFGSSDLYSAETSISVKEMFGLLEEHNAQQPFCQAELTSIGRCDDVPCDGSGPLVALCPKMCDRYDYSCDSIADWTKLVGGKVAQISTEAARKFAQKRQEPSYRQNRTLWLSSMVELASASLHGATSTPARVPQLMTQRQMPSQRLPRAPISFSGFPIER